MNNGIYKDDGGMSNLLLQSLREANKVLLFHNFHVSCMGIVLELLKTLRLLESRMHWLMRCLEH